MLKRGRLSGWVGLAAILAAASVRAQTFEPESPYHPAWQPVVYVAPLGAADVPPLPPQPVPAASPAADPALAAAPGPLPPADAAPTVGPLPPSDPRAFSVRHLLAPDVKPEAPAEKKADDKPAEKKWYDKLSLRGYAQVRINEVTSLEPDSAPPQHVGDRSVGDDQSFLIRRARLIFSGDVGDYTYVYLQPDFAVGVPGVNDSNQFAQIRDWYSDWYLDKTKVHRFRIGQSKVPYGWENMQSSSNRVPLDRSDALNSAVRNERDLGIFYYWTPEPAQDFFKEVIDLGLKGSGNYGVFGVGLYNGQGGSFNEQNDNLHVVARLTAPWQFENCQRIEASVQGYTGMYTVFGSPISPLGVGAPVTPLGTIATNRDGLVDKRVAWTFVWYPQPLGFQCEWNVGEGPALNDAQTEVVVRPLYGGYVMLLSKHDTRCWGTFLPFLRYNHFKGGYKPERNAPFSLIDETETGVEWQINKNMEIVLGYTFTNRTNTVAQSVANTRSYGQFDGEIFRCQFQFTY